MVRVSLIAWPPVGGWPGAVRHPGMGELVPVSFAKLFQVIRTHWVPHGTGMMADIAICSVEAVE